MSGGTEPFYTLTPAFASEDAAKEAAERDPASEDDAVTENRDKYQTVEEMIKKAEGSDGEKSSEQEMAKGTRGYLWRETKVRKGKGEFFCARVGSFAPEASLFTDLFMKMRKSLLLLYLYINDDYYHDSK